MQAVIAPPQNPFLKFHHQILSPNTQTNGRRKGEIPRFRRQLVLLPRRHSLVRARYCCGLLREVAYAEKVSSDKLRSECTMRLCWALVHSRRPDDVIRGIAMLEASLAGSNTPLETREKLNLLAIGHYRNADYFKSRLIVDRCLQALTLKKAIKHKIAKDVVIGFGIAATVVGVVAGGIAAALSVLKEQKRQQCTK